MSQSSVKKITKGRSAAAFGVAILADLMQFPLTLFTATGILSIPAEMADFVMDCIVMVLISRLIGFHWILLPSMIVELVPGLDLIPTWTGCVAWLVWTRKPAKGAVEVSVSPPVIEAAPKALPHHGNRDSS